MSGDNIDIDGAVDAGWSSYYDADEHAPARDSATASDGGETVAGSSPADDGDVSTDCWPTALDRADFTGTQQRVIELLSDPVNRTGKEAAEGAGCHPTTVSQIRSKVRCYADPDEVPFRIPEEPSKTSVSPREYQLYKEREGLAEVRSWNRHEHTAELRRRLVNGESLRQIAKEFDVSSATLSQNARQEGVSAVDTDVPPVERVSPDGANDPEYEFVDLSDSNESSDDSEAETDADRDTDIARDSEAETDADRDTDIARDSEPLSGRSTVEVSSRPTRPPRDRPDWVRVAVVAYIVYRVARRLLGR